MVERPTPDAGGMERRAYGEFVGPNGELAFSHAIGPDNPGLITD